MIRLAASLAGPASWPRSAATMSSTVSPASSTRRSTRAAPAVRSRGGSTACAARAASMPSATMASLELGQLVVRHEVVGEAHGDGVAGAERRARQRGVKAEQPGRTRQDEGAADVGNEPDTHFGHRHFRGVGDDADAAVRADADAAAHHDAVHQRDVRLRIAAIWAFITVLVVPEQLATDRGRRARCCRPRRCRRPRTGHARPRRSARRRLMSSSALPFGQGLRDRGDHRVGQRVDRLGPVEGDQADAAVDGY